MGFEPTRAEHNGLAVHHFNHSVTSSSARAFLLQCPTGASSHSLTWKTHLTFSDTHGLVVPCQKSLCYKKRYLFLDWKECNEDPLRSTCSFSWCSVALVVLAEHGLLWSEVEKVPPRFELGSLDSESRVLTITPWNLWVQHCELTNQLMFLRPVNCWLWHFRSTKKNALCFGIRKRGKTTLSCLKKGIWVLNTNVLSPLEAKL